MGAQTVAELKMLGIWLAVAALGLSGCNLTVNPPQVNINPTANLSTGGTSSSSSSSSGTPTPVPLSCSAGLTSANAAGTVASGSPVPIQVQVTGGTSPYQIIGVAGTFASSTTVSRTYSNNSLINQVVPDTVDVVDTAGLTAQCAFTVTVLPAAPTPPSNLGCTLQLSPSSPVIGQGAVVTATASGGTEPYTFKSLSLGSAGQLQSPLTAVSATQSSAEISYSVAGYQTISVQVEDAQSDVVSCSQNIVVRGLPAVQVTSSPSAGVAVGQTITLTATATNFASAPQIAFSTSEPGIQLTPNGTTATVSATDNSPHQFSVTVKATTANGDYAVEVVPLQFTPASLSCTISPVSGTIAVGNPTAFSVTASNGTALTITHASAGPTASVQSVSASSVNVTFSAAGPQTVSITAQSAGGIPCNGGNPLQEAVTVSSPLSCNVLSNPNGWAYAGQPIYFSPEVTGGTGAVTLESLTIFDNGNPTTYTSPPGEAGMYLTIEGPGVFQIQLAIEDSDNVTATCTATEVVYGW
jgi:hypothetical protein